MNTSAVFLGSIACAVAVGACGWRVRARARRRHYRNLALACSARRLPPQRFGIPVGVDPLQIQDITNGWTFSATEPLRATVEAQL